MKRALWALALALAGFAVWVVSVNRSGEPDPAPLPAGFRPDPALVARGAYLARAGNCLGCHTARGGAAGAGGRAIETPFGTVFAGNLTPDAETGLGRWSADELWRALHEGRARDGRLLTPAFPYPAFTHITRADSDALHAWLHSLPAVRQANRPHQLRFPYGTQTALALWRAFYFRPTAFQPDPTQDAAWNRGAYLVSGLGHCASCHAPRNALGATLAGPALGGGLMPGEAWHAPGLGGAQEAAHLVALLQTGSSPRGTALGPMAEVVVHSTQHLSPIDLHAMARYLGTRPAPTDEAPAAAPHDAQRLQTLQLGAKLYAQHCAECHGERGEGVPDRFPALAGNRTVQLLSPLNTLQVIRHGGYAPATAAQPRPFGMPPFGHLLSDTEIAAVASHVRSQFGNAAPVVTPLQVLQAR
jgi:mono/diheme cytochrome c family protein